MNPFRHYLGRRYRSPPWNDKTPVREELFGVGRLEQHAESLAAAQSVTTTPPRVLSLHTRLKDNATALLDASYGPGWTCNRGYEATDKACIALQVPENAHLDYSGNDWECNQPYLKRAGGCALR
jgi:hypothetical protein